MAQSLLDLTRYTIRERLTLLIGLWLATASALILVQPSGAVGGLLVLVTLVLSFALAASITRPVMAMHQALEQQRQQNVEERLQHEEERIKLVQQMTDAYQSSLTQIVDDVQEMASVIARQYEEAALKPPSNDTVH